MSLFGQNKRHSISTGRRSPLPIFSANSSEKRYGLSSPSPLGTNGGSGWYSIIYVPIPRIPFISRSSSSESLMNGTKAYGSHSAQRFVRVYLPIPPRLIARLPRSTPIRIIALLLISLVVGLFLLGFRKRPDGRNTWSPPFVDPSTVVLLPEEIASIWEWEVKSGHHPSLEQGRCNFLSRIKFCMAGVGVERVIDIQHPRTFSSHRQYTTPPFLKLSYPPSTPPPKPRLHPIPIS